MNNLLFIPIQFSTTHKTNGIMEIISRVPKLALTKYLNKMSTAMRITKEELKVELEFFDRFKIANPDFIQPIGLTHLNLKEESAKLKKRIHT